MPYERVLCRHVDAILHVPVFMTQGAEVSNAQENKVRMIFPRNVFMCLSLLEARKNNNDMVEEHTIREGNELKEEGGGKTLSSS